MKDYRVNVGRLFQSPGLGMSPRRDVGGALVDEAKQLATQLARGQVITLEQVDHFLSKNPSPREKELGNILLGEIRLQQAGQRDRIFSGIRIAGEGQVNLQMKGFMGKLDMVWSGLVSRLKAAMPDALFSNTGDALIKLIVKGDVEGARSLKELVNLQGSDGNAAVIIAAFRGQTEILKMLLDAGGTVDALDPTMKGTALHAAAWAGHTGTAQLLIGAGVDLDAVGPYNGFTALHDAVLRGNGAVVGVLISAGADLSIRSHDGETAADMARRLGRSEIAAQLEKAE